ncbi:MG2 domain-containing protein [Fibrella arboris]|uniref:MG2 domain-containing protein n=1 Tax=Fibrella arboris TaxID=3242486 RepID=UPI0035228F7A
MLVALTALRVAEDDPLSRILESFNRYTGQFPYEKVYLHTDRVAYLPGETIWMKSYLFYGENHGADSTSGSVWIDLVSSNGRKILLDTRIRSKGGYGDGYLTLPDTLSTGRYTLRAYTSWMRNFSEEWYFNQVIEVVKPSAPPAPQLGTASTKTDVQFLPESGHWVVGLPGRMAFKAINSAGIGIDVAGYVLNARKDTVAGFASQHLGMGAFPLTPEAGQTYTAYVRMKDGDTYSAFPLPAPQNTGYILQVDNLTNKENIRVFVMHNLPVSGEATAAAGATSPGAAAGPATAQPMLSIVAQVNGAVVYAAKAPTNRPRFLVAIPRNKCPQGIVQITLFDEKGKPVSERLAYSDHNEVLKLTVKPTRTSVGVRQRVDLTVTATNAEGAPVAANLSLAVTDTRQQPAFRPNGRSLVSFLLLTSELAGYVEQPGYYFDQSKTDRLVKLDLLMMTQGWRRFTWEKILANTYPPTRFLVDTSLTLTGTVYQGTSRVPAPGTELLVMRSRKDSSRETGMVTADQEGRFFLHGMTLIDTNTVFIQASRGTSHNFNVVLDKLYSPQVRLVRPPLSPLAIDYEQLAELLKRQKAYLDIERQISLNNEIQLQTVTVKGKKADPYAQQRSMYGTPDNTLVVDDMMAAGQTSVFDLLRRIAGVQVTGGGPTPSVTVRNSAPMFMLDGMRSDIQAIANIPPQTVANIDVLKGAGASVLGASSVINVITKRGGAAKQDYSKMPAAPGVLIEKVVGYAPQRQFYAPRFDAATPDERVRPDYRATLFWAPTIRTDATGKATTSFFASDAKTTLRFVVEGATKTGQPGYVDGTMKVE